MRSHFTRREVMVGASALGLAAAAVERATAQAAKPNIVFILADDLGYGDVSCYGRRDYTTANIDRLARDGMRFMQAYANSAVGSATRTALITGRYQYRYPIGLEEPLLARDVGLSPDVPDAALAPEESRLCDRVDRQVALGRAAEIRAGEERL